MAESKWCDETVTISISAVRTIQGSTAFAILIDDKKDKPTINKKRTELKIGDKKVVKKRNIA